MVIVLSEGLKGSKWIKRSKIRIMRIPTQPSFENLCFSLAMAILIFVQVISAKHIFNAACNVIIQYFKISQRISQLKRIISDLIFFYVSWKALSDQTWTFGIFICGFSSAHFLYKQTFKWTWENAISSTLLIRLRFQGNR